MFQNILPPAGKEIQAQLRLSSPDISSQKWRLSSFFRPEGRFSGEDNPKINGKSSQTFTDEKL